MDDKVKHLDVYDEEDFNEIDLTQMGDVESDAYKKVQNLQIKFNNLNKQSGLWLISAYFNHSCISNVTLNTIGDLIFKFEDLPKKKSIQFVFNEIN